jgi:hypothetical protein
MSCLRSFNHLALVSLAWLGFSGSASAAIMSADDSEFGVGSITKDTYTGLEWLDVTESTNRSYNYVSGQFGVGGAFEGWRHANSTEVMNFLNSGGGVGTYNGDLGSHQNWVVNLVDLWGSTAASHLNYQRVLATLSDNFSSTNKVVTNIRYSEDLTGNSRANVFGNSISPGDSFPHFGHALVRTSVVPVPATAWLFGTGILGLIGFSKRKAATLKTA